MGKFFENSKRLFEKKGPVIVECPIDYSENVQYFFGVVDFVCCRFSCAWCA